MHEEQMIPSGNTLAPPTCPICMSEVSPQETERTACGHNFHASCIREWRRHSAANSGRSEAECPVCRSVETVDRRKVQNTGEEMSEKDFQRLLEGQAEGYEYERSRGDVLSEQEFDELLSQMIDEEDFLALTMEDAESFRVARARMYQRYLAASGDSNDLPEHSYSNEVDHHRNKIREALRQVFYTGEATSILVGCRNGAANLVIGAVSAAASPVLVPASIATSGGTKRRILEGGLASPVVAVFLAGSGVVYCGQQIAGGLTNFPILYDPYN